MGVETEKHGAVVVLRMAREPVNALDLALLTELVDTLDDLAAGDAPPLVLTGAGRAFSAGVDLRRIAVGSDRYISDFMPMLSRAFRTVFQYPAPTVAAVNGHAIAGGLVLAAACDHRVAADVPGRTGLSELQVGVPFPTSAIEIIRYAFGTPVATRLVLGADLIELPLAVRTGLMDELVAATALIPTAVGTAAQRAERGTAAYQATKLQLQRPTREAIARHSAAEDPTVDQAWANPGTLDRISSFLRTISRGT